MINLYLADKHGSFEDLFKASITGMGPRTGNPGGGSRTGTGGGPRTGSGGGPRTGTGGPRPAKVPGAASGASGMQTIDCPLGAACPDGGKHQMGSSRLQEHSQQAMSQQTTGETPGDESAGKPTGKPGVEPGSQNIGSVGSDQVQRKPAPVGPEAQTQPEEQAPGVQDPAQETAPAGKKAAKPKKPRAAKKPAAEAPQQSAPGVTSTPNAKPMDHYRLAQVARDSGDEDLAKQHEEFARKRSDELGSEDHRELANELRREGMNDHADYHDNVHQRVQSMQGDKPKKKAEDPEKVKAKAKKHEEKLRDVHAETKIEANSDLEAAKKKHKETVSKLEKLKASNKEKQEKHEKAKSEHAKKKASGSKAKPPEKPELQKEEAPPEKPELSEPQTDAEKLQHETHTQRAKRVADNIASHIKDNSRLSPEDKARLERAHRMAVYHSNIGYTPTAAHKKELGEIERAAGEHSKVHHDEIKAKEQAEQAKADQKAAQQAAKQEQADRKQAEKMQAQQAKEQQKQDQANAKAQADMPKMPQSDLDHARIQDHKAKAQKIRANLESQAQNPNLPPEVREKHQRILAELDKHENLEHVPGSDHLGELKEIEKLAGEHGKKPYSPEDAAEEEEAPEQTEARPYDSGGSTVLGMLNSGRGLGQGLAASATSPYGAAGHLGSQIVNYGVTGSVTAGHRLLHDAESARKRADTAQAQFDKEKDRQEKQANAASQVKDGEMAKVTGRGNT